jgi:hypothetical protein
MQAQFQSELKSKINFKSFIVFYASFKFCGTPQFTANYA